jgi:hypothetical protein
MTIHYNTATFIQEPRKPITGMRLFRKWFAHKIKTYEPTPLPCFMHHYEEFSSYVPRTRTYSDGKTSFI